MSWPPSPWTPTGSSSIQIPRSPRSSCRTDRSTHTVTSSGPAQSSPTSPRENTRRATPSKDQLFALRDFLGVDKNVIVQATCHGADNRPRCSTPDLVQGKSPRSRDRAPRRQPDELAEMHDIGSARRALQLRSPARRSRTRRYYHRIVEKIAPFGWHVVIYFEASDLEERWDFFTVSRDPSSSWIIWVAPT
jgi:2-pyrone-4,6-dicarboxylate lactonase